MKNGNIWYHFLHVYIYRITFLLINTKSLCNGILCNSENNITLCQITVSVFQNHFDYSRYINLSIIFTFMHISGHLQEKKVNDIMRTYQKRLATHRVFGIIFKHIFNRRYCLITR